MGFVEMVGLHLQVLCVVGLLEGGQLVEGCLVVSVSSPFPAHPLERDPASETDVPLGPRRITHA